MATRSPTTRLNNVPSDNRQDSRLPVCRSDLIIIDSDNHEGTAYDGSDNNILIKDVEVPNGEVVGVAVAAPQIPTDTEFTLDLYDDEVDGGKQTIQILNKTSISDNGNSYVDLTSDNLHFAGNKVTFDVSWSTDDDLTANNTIFDFVFYVKTP